MPRSRAAQSPRDPARGTEEHGCEHAGHAGHADPFDFGFAERPEGQALPAGTRARLEAALGAPLGHVRVHTGEEAAAAADELDAEAFASGHDIFFAAGKYAPGTPEGDHLIAHEVAHTVQQRGGAGVAAKATIGAGDGALEREADRFAEAMSGERPGTGLASQLSTAPAGTISRHGRGGGGAQAPAGQRNARPRGPVLNLRWRGTARESYRGFFRNVNSDPAQAEEWIDHLLSITTAWQIRGQTIPLEEFERRANELHLEILPVFGNALPYIESVTGRRAAQLEAMNAQSVHAERVAETALANLDDFERRHGLPSSSGQNGASGANGGQAGGEGTGRGTARRQAPLGAAPSELLGSSRAVVGGRNSYQMRVTLGANDTSDNPLEDSRAIDRGTFTFEVFDATALARASNHAATDSNANTTTLRRAGATTPAAPDPLAAQTDRLRQGGTASGGRTVTSADSNSDSLNRIDRALSGDAVRAAGEYEEARRDGRTTDAVIGATNVLLTPTSAAVAYGGYALNRVVDALFGNAQERAIPFPSPGTFIVRCIAQPLRLDGQPARPPSVAVHVVDVSEAHAMAHEALDEPAARIAELELRRDQAADPDERVRAEQALTTAHTMAEGTPAAVITLSRDRLDAEISRVNRALRVAAGRRTTTADEAFDKETELRRLRAELAQLNTQRGTVQTQLDLANTRHTELGGVTFRPHVVIVDEESGDRMELLLEVAEPLPQSDGYHCSVSDTTSASGHMYRAVGRDRTEAIWEALRRVANGNDYGRGRMFVRVPDTVALTGGRDRDFTNAPGSTALLRQRLADLGTVATALATVSVPGAGELAMVVGAATAATNLATRLSESTLHLDAESINDVLNVLTAAAAGARLIGRIRIDPRAVEGRIALVPVEASAVSRTAQGVSTALDRIQVITTTYATMQQFDDIARQEASGSISHARAREMRARALIGHVQTVWATASQIAHGGGDGTTGNGVINLPDAPANTNVNPNAGAPHGGGDAAPVVAHPGPVAGPGSPSNDGGGGVDPHHRDAILPPPPQGTEPANTPTIIPQPPRLPNVANAPNAQPNGQHPAVDQAHVATLPPQQPQAPAVDQAHVATLPPQQPQAPAVDQAHVATLPPQQPAQHQGNAPAAVPPPQVHNAQPAPHVGDSHAPTLVPPPPANEIEAHQLARAQRAAPTIPALPTGTRIVPDATPSPLPAGWMRLSEFGQFLRMMGTLRSAPRGREVINGIVQAGGIVTMTPGVGHFQNGNRINIDPTVHHTATARAGMVGHEGDHLVRPERPNARAANQTEDQYVSSVMRHEAFAQASLLEVRRALLERNGQQVAPNGSNINEYGAPAYFSAYTQAHAAHLAAHPGDNDGAHRTANQAGVDAIAAMWHTVPVSIPGVGNYEQYARSTYRAANPQAQPAQPAQPVQAQPAQAQPAQPAQPVQAQPAQPAVDPAQFPSTLPPPPPQQQGERTTIPGY